MSTGYVCPECGLDYDTVSPTDAPVAVRSYPRRFRELFDRIDDRVLRTRPSPKRWSALEYAAHVADVFEFMAEAQHRTRLEDHPSIAFWDPDEKAAADRYAEQQPAAVLQRMAAAAEDFAKEIEQVEGGDWSRPASYAWGERDALAMMRNGVHEGYHHLRDGSQNVELLGGSAPDDED